MHFLRGGNSGAFKEALKNAHALHNELVLSDQRRGKELHEQGTVLVGSQRVSLFTINYAYIVKRILRLLSDHKDDADIRNRNLRSVLAGYQCAQWCCSVLSRVLLQVWHVSKTCGHCGSCTLINLLAIQALQTPHTVGTVSGWCICGANGPVSLRQTTASNGLTTRSNLNAEVTSTVPFAPLLCAHCKFELLEMIDDSPFVRCP